MKKVHSCYFYRGIKFLRNGSSYTFQFHETDKSNNKPNRYYSFHATDGNEWIQLPAGKYETETEIRPKLADRLDVFWQTIIIPISTFLLISFFLLSFYLMAVRESGNTDQQQFWFGKQIKK